MSVPSIEGVLYGVSDLRVARGLVIDIYILCANGVPCLDQRATFRVQCWGFVAEKRGARLLDAQGAADGGPRSLALGVARSHSA